MSAVTINDLTTGTLEGTGIFDELMRTVSAHVQEEHSKSRIKGPEYSTVYLGAMQSVMDRSLQFLLEQQRTDLQAQLLEKQVANATKEGLLLDKQALKLDKEILLIQEQIESEEKNNMLDGVIDKQICKLNGEFDLLVQQKLKATEETGVLAQKRVTEQAQTSGVGVDADSVIGKQKTLYTYQAEGFLRDAEQKGARLLIDTWNTRRMTDETLQADDITNGLGSGNIKRVVDRMLTGINA